MKKSTIQALFLLYMILLAIGSLNAQKIDRSTLEPRIQHALRYIESTYNVQVALRPLQSVRFGTNFDIDGPEETIWAQGGIEVLPTTNAIDNLVSTNAGDTQAVIIEGVVLNEDGTTTEVVFADTLNGTTPVSLNIPLYRVEFMINANAVDFAGDVYVYSGGAVVGGVPQVADSINLKIPVGYNQSVKSGFYASSKEFFIITEIQIGATNSANSLRKVIGTLEVRNKGKVWKRVVPFSVSTTQNSSIYNFNPCIIVPSNSDIRIIASSTGPDVEVRGAAYAYVAYVVGTK